MAIGLAFGGRGCAAGTTTAGNRGRGCAFGMVGGWEFDKCVPQSSRVGHGPALRRGECNVRAGLDQNLANPPRELAKQTQDLANQSQDLAKQTQGLAK